MNVLKKAAVVVSVALLAFSLSACGEKIPDSTSTDWGLYGKVTNGTKTVVDDTGKLTLNYSLDKKGNVIDKQKTIIIGKDNLYDFVDVTDISSADNSWTEITLDTKIVETGTGRNASRKTEPVETQTRVTLNVKPEYATNKTVILDSSNPDVAEIIGVDENGELSLKPSEGSASVTFDLLYKNEGSTNITARSLDGNFETNFPVKVLLNEHPTNEADFQSTTQPTQNTPERNDVVSNQGVGTASQQEVNNQTLVEVTGTNSASDAIPTTENTRAWINGSKVNLRSEPNTSSDVLGTYSSGKEATILGSATGWSKVQIDNQVGYVKTVYVTKTDPNANAAANNATVVVNGTATSTNTGYTGQQTYQQSYYTTNTQNRTTTSNGNGSSGTNNTTNGTNATQSADVNAPIAANDGTDRGYAFSAVAAPVGQTGHVHDYKLAQVVKASGSTPGYSLYKCSCGASYKGDYVDGGSADDNGHVHTYKTTVVPPTCEDMGYTEHTCTTCGEDSYRDSFTNPKGHSFTESYDEENGVMKYTCSLCGYSYTEEL